MMSDVNLCVAAESWSETDDTSDQQLSKIFHLVKKRELSFWLTTRPGLGTGSRKLVAGLAVMYAVLLPSRLCCFGSAGSMGMKWPLNLNQTTRQRDYEDHTFYQPYHDSISTR